MKNASKNNPQPGQRYLWNHPDCSYIGEVICASKSFNENLCFDIMPLIILKEYRGIKVGEIIFRANLNNRVKDSPGKWTQLSNQDKTTHNKE